MLDAVGMNEINKIFTVLDAMGIHREHVIDHRWVAAFCDSACFNRVWIFSN